MILEDNKIMDEIKLELWGSFLKEKRVQGKWDNPKQKLGTN